MIELRWMTTVRNLRAGPVRVLQYRRVLGYVEATAPSGYKYDEPYSWSEWENIPEVMIPRKTK